MQYLVIPAYEPDEKLFKLVEEAYETAMFKVIVVDDGSENKSVFNEIKDIATVLTHDVNRGKGAALKTAFRYIKELCEDGVIVTADADGQHGLLDICRTLKCAKENKGKLITGVRKFDDRVPLKSRLGNIITRRIFKLASGMYVSDTQCGLQWGRRKISCPVYNTIQILTFRSFSMCFYKNYMITTITFRLKLPAMFERN